MFYPLPTNIIPFFILGISASLFGLRGLYLYNKRKSPLSFYFGLGALLVGLSTLFYSVPFFFTQDEATLKVLSNIGDQLYFLSILVMARLIWYLGFNKQISFSWVLTPYLLLVIGCNIAIFASWLSIHYEFNANQVYYPVSMVASWFFAAMSSAFVFVGILTMKQARTLKDLRQKIRLNSIGLAFLLGGLIAIYNYLFLQGSNSNSIGTLGYISIAIVLFMGIFIISRKSKSSKN